MKKNWKKKNDFRYELWLDDYAAGSMELNISSAQSIAYCSFENKIIEIKRTGFWKTNIEISNDQNNMLLKARPEKWYANTLLIEFDSRKLNLTVRNNPLAEYVIMENKKEILAYGLCADNKNLTIRIISANEKDVMLDFLLWYLFVPIANENFGSDYLFA